MGTKKSEQELIKVTEMMMFTRVVAIKRTEKIATEIIRTRAGVAKTSVTIR